MPGPGLFIEYAETTYTLIFSLLVANILFGILGLWLCRYLVVVTKVPGAVLGLMILVFSVIGTYALRNEMFDVGLAMAFGAIGFFMERWRYPAAPMVLALMLGPIFEVNFRRSMQISQWDLTTFLTRPLSSTPCLLVIAALVSIWTQRRRRAVRRASPWKRTHDFAVSTMLPST